MKELDRCWKDCIRLWKWVAKEWLHTETCVVILKIQWLVKHPALRSAAGLSNCFFCVYAKNRCSQCPGRLIDPDFHCTLNTYHYRRHPDKFYEKLIELNRIRLQQQKEGAEE